MARIDGYRFGRVLIDGREETRDVIVLPERVVRNWWRRDGHSLVLDDLEDVLEELPPRLIVGTGISGRMRPDPRTLEHLGERGIDVEVVRTDEAVRRFAELAASQAAAVAGGSADRFRAAFNPHRQATMPAMRRVAPNQSTMVASMSAQCISPSLPRMYAQS
jgi:hypothetical protein